MSWETEARRCVMCNRERNARIISDASDEMHPIYACSDCVEYAHERAGISIKEQLKDATAKRPQNKN